MGQNEEANVLSNESDDKFGGDNSGRDLNTRLTCRWKQHGQCSCAKDMHVSTTNSGENSSRSCICAGNRDKWVTYCRIRILGPVYH